MTTQAALAALDKSIARQKLQMGSALL